MTVIGLVSLGRELEDDMEIFSFLFFLVAFFVVVLHSKVPVKFNEAFSHELFVLAMTFGCKQQKHNFYKKMFPHCKSMGEPQMHLDKRAQMVPLESSLPSYCSNTFPLFDLFYLGFA